METTRCTELEHDALKNDDVEWFALPALKPWETEPGVVLLCRNCPRCNSTLAREMAPQGDDT